MDSSLRLICCEEIDGRRWKYFAESGGSKRLKKGSIRAVSLQSPQAPVEVSLFTFMNILLNLFVYSCIYAVKVFIYIFSVQ